LLLATLAWAQNAPGPAWLLPQSSGLENPESAYYDATHDVIFVSNIAGLPPSKKDGRGWITTVSPKGKVLDKQWISGLNSPKGLRSYGNTLWVADIDILVSMDIGKRQIIARISVPGARFLNDVAISKQGVVYVSDMVANKIYAVYDNKVSVFAEGEQLEFPNGLLAHQNKLVVAAYGKDGQYGRLYYLDLQTRKKTLITPMPLGQLDGLELDDAGNYLVSSWQGVHGKGGCILRISPTGKITPLFANLQSPADIGLVAKQNLLLVPNLMESKVAAFTLPQK
jgi:sugar lactone lactonase YvrE